MAHVLRETRIVERGDDRDPDMVDSRAVLTVGRVVYFIAGILTGLLALRFVLALFGANPANPFADFIYTLSRPFVAPFAGLFNVQTQYGASRFELETLIAIAVYTFVAWMIVKFLTTVTNTDEDEV